MSCSDRVDQANDGERRCLCQKSDATLSRSSEWVVLRVNPVESGVRTLPESFSRTSYVVAEIVPGEVDLEVFA
jgi:hypothetical protein